MSRLSIHMETKRQGVELADYVFAGHVAFWLCVLPILLRACSLPSLLRLLSNRNRPQSIYRRDLDRLVGIAVRVCQLRFFHLPIFPRHCLRQSLVLYYEMRRMGYLPIIHFGIQRREQGLSGHSWVTFNGREVGGGGPLEPFSIVYSYPPEIPNI